jgi:hypothetical protein
MKAMMKNQRVRIRELADFSRALFLLTLFFWFGSSTVAVMAMSHEAKFSFMALPEGQPPWRGFSTLVRPNIQMLIRA